MIKIGKRWYDESKLTDSEKEKLGLQKPKEVKKPKLEEKEKVKKFDK